MTKPVSKAKQRAIAKQRKRERKAAKKRAANQPVNETHVEHNDHFEQITHGADHARVLELYRKEGGESIDLGIAQGESFARLVTLANERELEAMREGKPIPERNHTIAQALASQRTLANLIKQREKKLHEIRERLRQSNTVAVQVLNDMCRRNNVDPNVMIEFFHEQVALNLGDHERELMKQMQRMEMMEAGEAMSHGEAVSPGQLRQQQELETALPSKRRDEVVNANPNMLQELNAQLQHHAAKLSGGR